MYRRHVRNVSERQSAFVVFINFFFSFFAHVPTAAARVQFPILDLTSHVA